MDDANTQYWAICSRWFSNEATFAVNVPALDTWLGWWCFCHCQWGEYTYLVSTYIFFAHCFVGLYARMFRIPPPAKFPWLSFKNSKNLNNLANKSLHVISIILDFVIVFHVLENTLWFVSNCLHNVLWGTRGVIVLKNEGHRCKQPLFIWGYYFQKHSMLSLCKC